MEAIIYSEIRMGGISILLAHFFNFFHLNRLLNIFPIRVKNVSDDFTGIIRALLVGVNS